MLVDVESAEELVSDDVVESAEESAGGVDSWLSVVVEGSLVVLESAEVVVSLVEVEESGVVCDSEAGSEEGGGGEVGSVNVSIKPGSA